MSDSENNSQRLTSFRAVIPFYILYDLELNANHLRLYGQVEQMESCPNPGVEASFSFQWLSRQLGINHRNVRKMASVLIKKNYITHIEISPGNWVWNTVKKPVVQQGGEVSGRPGGEVSGRPGGEVSGRPGGEVSGRPPKIPEDKIPEYNIKNIKKDSFTVSKMLDDKRYLRIPVAPILEAGGVSHATGGGVAKDMGGGVAKDTQLDQSNIISKINKTFVDFKSTDSYKDDELFMRFYSVYPRKEKPSVARKAFYKCKPTEEFVSMLVDDIYKRIDQNWKNRPKSTIPFPSTYLNSKEWEGEISISETNIKKFTAKTKYKTMDDIMGGVL